MLGKLSGESVKMLVHHSRNSEQKQVICHHLIQPRMLILQCSITSD